MKPRDVRYHHIRDHPWPQKWCAKCCRMVPKFHEHFGRKFTLPFDREQFRAEHGLDENGAEG